MPKVDAQREKKVLERRVIEHARKRSTIFPPGDLSEFESPDWLIPSASLGIEVSMLLPQKKPQHAFSGPQLSAFQQQVVLKAESLYYFMGGQAADVLVYFRNDWHRKRDVSVSAQALAEFVLKNYPLGQTTVTFENDGRGNWVDGFNVIRILPEKGTWGASASSDGEDLTYESLAARIATKDTRVSEYRMRLPGSQIWLLFATSPSVLWSLSTPREVESWRFYCAFDKVLLCSWEYGCIDLSRAP